MAAELATPETIEAAVACVSLGSKAVAHVEAAVVVNDAVNDGSDESGNETVDVNAVQERCHGPEQQGIDH